MHWSILAAAASETKRPVALAHDIEDACIFTKDPDPQHKILEREQELLMIKEPPFKDAREPFIMQPCILSIDFGF
jgi:hypothetical protein